MSAAWSWLIICVAGSVAAACAWIAVRRITAPPPGPDIRTVMSWPEDQRRAWMSHPMHTHRCHCRRWGLPFPGTAVLDDDLILHDDDVCAPQREAA